MECMADNSTEPVNEIAPEIVAAAKKLLAKRFRYIKNPDDSLKRLARIGADHVARDMVANPGRYAPDKPLEELPEVSPLDPLDILRKDHQLPALPQVFLELQQAIGAKATSADDLAEIISQDPGLTAFLLRMVNSAFYSLPMQIDTISRAVTVVGVNQLSTLAVGTSVMSLFKDVPFAILDMEQFWKHSVACGLIARRLCRITGQPMLSRTVIARAFATYPELLLMDEPYGQLDLDLRFKLEDELIKLWQKTKTTLIFITHNVEEAVYLGERIMVLTNKPTKIKQFVDCDLERPRDVASPEFVKIRNEVTELIRWW